MRDEFVTFSVTVSEYNMNERSLFERRALFPFSLGGGIAGEARPWTYVSWGTLARLIPKKTS